MRVAIVGNIFSSFSLFVKYCLATDTFRKLQQVEHIHS